MSLFSQCPSVAPQFLQSKKNVQILLMVSSSPLPPDSFPSTSPGPPSPPPHTVHHTWEAGSCLQVSVVTVPLPSCLLHIYSNVTLSEASLPSSPLLPPTNANTLHSLSYFSFLHSIYHQLTCYACISFGDFHTGKTILDNSTEMKKNKVNQMRDSVFKKTKLPT